MFFSPAASEALDDDIGNDLQKSLGRSKVLVQNIKARLAQGTSITSEVTELKAAAENVRISNMLIEERFKLREEKVKALGTKAVERHQAMAEGYRKALTDYLTLIDNLPSDGTIPQSAIQNLQALLEKILPKKKRPIIGSLPYKHLNYPSQQPTTASSITPAYLGGNKTVSTDDTNAAPEAPISNEIATLAQSLNWNPVSIYEYVKNNIDTEWYWGCQKGAEETLRQGSGNDCDQAALLTALLRASGFPTRYVRGVIQFFPDIERAKNLTGIDDPMKIAEFFQKAGIPYAPFIAGGKIANIQIEHVWVESQIPYSNYRGVVIDAMGKTWLGLDTSIKVKGYTYNSAKDIFQEPGVSSQMPGIRDEYLGLSSQPTNTQPATPLEYLQSSINSELQAQNSQLLYADFLRTRVLIPEVLNILPASMQFTLIKATNEYTALPNELIHKVKFTATDPNKNDLFTITLPTYKLSNQQIVISYEPETVQDQEIIDSYGGLDNTPAYLVHLRPVLKINNERMVVGTGGLPMGSEYDLTVELIGASGVQSSEKITNTHIVGNLSVIGISAQRAILTPSPLAGEGGGEGEKDAARLLYEEAMNYNDRWNKAEDELASLLHLSVSRPLPSVVTLGGVIDVTYLLDTPHGFTWKGVFIDAGERAIETVASDESRVKTFMQLSSLQGSVLENRIFEDDFKVESISTAKLFQVANAQSPSSLLTIDKTNIDAVLPTLPFDDNIKEDMVNAVNQGFALRTPTSEQAYHAWTGIGYNKENPDTGESGWMLTGMIAGGMTAINKDQWIAQDIAGILSLPNSQPSNPNAGAVVRLARMSDYQTGFAGSTLTVPCQARAEDSAGKPVQNVPVTFKIAAGGGTVQGEDKLGNVLPNVADNTTTAASEYIVKTGPDGIARVMVTLGKKVDDSPLYRQEVGTNQTYWELVGLNMVAMTASGNSGVITTDKPFEAYARAGAAVKFEVISPKTTFYGLPNTFAASAWIKVEDQYGNSISGKNVNFFVERAFLGQDPGTAAKTARLYPTEAACPGIPTLDCPNAKEYTAVDPLVQSAEHFGAMAYVILGNTANTRFTIKAAAKQDLFNATGKRVDTDTPLPTAQMVYQTNAKNGVAPEFALTALAVYQYDEQGNKTDAGKAGSPFPEKLTTALLYHAEGYESSPAVDASGNYYLKGTGVFTVSKVNNGQVTFTPILGGGSVNPLVQTAATDGQYSTDLTLGASPGLNIIQAVGSASVGTPAVDATSGVISTSTRPLQAQTEFDIWSVKPTVMPNQLILINSDGYPVSDTDIRFTVEPANYPYSTRSLYLDFYEKDTLGRESMMGFVQADPSGKIILTRGGAKFNPAYTYSVQLTVDRGTKKEIVSGKVSLPVAQFRVVTDEETPKEADEIKFGDGSKPNKRYKIEFKSAALAGSCTSMNGLASTIRTTLASGQTATALGDAYYPVQYALTFSNIANGCDVKINGKDKFIISNMSTATLEARAAQLQQAGTTIDLSALGILYGGLGNHIQISANNTLLKDIPIEPVGVIVLGIDGLRQDVLYAPQGSSDGTGVNVSYSDPSGCVSGSCNVQPTDLKGLCEVLGGTYSLQQVPSPWNPDLTLTGSGLCTYAGWENKHIKLPNVTAIFPSITFASWASIFSGKLPNETGILGNEFFARDRISYDSINRQYSWTNLPGLSATIPGLETFPPGMVTLDADGGAFSPGGSSFALSHVLPVEYSLFGYFVGATSLSQKLQLSAPNAALKAEPLWSSIGSIVHGKYITDANTRCDQSNYECATVSIFNQYARGADWWSTPSSFWKDFFNVIGNFGKSAKIMDASSAGEVESFINGYYLKLNPNGKKKRFPAVFSIYLPGIDHYAHLNGLGDYVNYFKNTTDVRVKNIVNDLKQQDEFDNKIFIITADHGHTAMPTDLKYPVKVKIENPLNPTQPPSFYMAQYDAESSCNLKLNFSDSASTGGVNFAKEAEQANNNLHIWELGTLFTDFAPTVAGIKLLAPAELNNTGINITQKPDQANVIAALNGPMAYIYVKGASWQSDPDQTRLGVVIDTLIRVLSMGENASDKVKMEFSRLYASVDKILVRRTLNGPYEVVTGVVEDDSGNVTINADSLEALNNAAYIKAAIRVAGMNHKERSGDIVLLMKDATMGNAIDRYTTGVACKSWHGSLNPSDSYVPFIVAYPGGNKFELDPILNTVCPSNNCDGNWKLSDMVKKIMETQYSGQ